MAHTSTPQQSSSTRLARKAFGATMVAALALAGCTSDPDSGMSMTIGYTAIGAAYADLYICQDQGVFAKNGLAVRLKLLNSSSQLVPALASDSVQIGAGLVRSTAAAVLRGLQLRYVALPIPRYFMEMWGNPALTSPQDLKGKKIGLSSPGSLGDAALDAFLAATGWTENDVHKTFLQSSPAQVTALEKGAVDAIVAQPPTGTETRKKGFAKIMDFTKYPAAANAYTLTDAYLETHRPAVAAFVKAEVECLAMLHQDKKAAEASIVKHSGYDDPALADYAYRFYDPIWAKTPLLDPKLVDQAFTEAAAIDGGTTKPSDTSRYIDNSFVAQLQSSGFIDSLYRTQGQS
jgi:NitT/TauT family transport system substrate-binding protein